MFQGSRVGKGPEWEGPELGASVEGPQEWEGLRPRTPGGHVHDCRSPRRGASHIQVPTFQGLGFQCLERWNVFHTSGNDVVCHREDAEDSCCSMIGKTFFELRCNGTFESDLTIFTIIRIGA